MVETEGSGDKRTDLGKVAQDIIPIIDDTYNLGSISKRWAAIFVILAMVTSITIGGAIKLTTTDFGLIINDSTQIQGDLIIDKNLTVKGNFTVLGNTTILNVTTLNVNGSILPALDDTFDFGTSSLRWKDLYLSRNLFSNGTGDNWFLGNLGIKTANPSVDLHINDTQTILRLEDSNTLPNTEGFFNAQIEFFGLGTDGGNLGYSGTSAFDIDVASDNEFRILMAGSEKLRITTGGNVGINTTSPQNLFNVVGIANITSNFTVDESTFFVDSSSNFVGIGTASPGAELHISASSPNLFIDATGGTTSSIRFRDGTTQSWRISRFPGNDDLRIVADLADLNVMTFRTSGNVGIGITTPNYLFEVATGTENAVNLSNLFFINDTSGKIGIGTANPSRKLDVRSGTTDFVARFESSDVGVGIELADDTGTIELVGIAGDILFRTNDSTERMRILNSNGNVGIGTASPDSLLDINTAGVASVGLTITDGAKPVAKLHDGSSVDANGILQLFDNDGNEDVRWYAASEFNNWVNNGGNVGIGTTSPSALLDIDEGTGRGIIEVDGSTGGCLKIRDTDDAGFTYCTALNGNLSCSTSAC